MEDPIRAQIVKIRASIRGLEAQRSLLGDAIVNPAIESLQQKLTQLEQRATEQSTPTEERSIVTILFTDMVGSTSMAEKLDPEDWRQIVSKTHTAIGEAITNHHGMIAQYLGDGLLAFFGAKEAGENDPENAIRAALQAQSAVTNLLSEEKVQVRIGIHTGLVVVGEMGAEAHKEFTASGDAVNLAARLQSAAPPGGVLVSHDTYRYVRGVFDVTLTPPLTIKGRSEPVKTYMVRGAKPRPFRSVARGVAGVETRTVGREQEVLSLHSAYRRAFEGHSLVWAQLVGDPGVGKSRMLEDMSDWLELRTENIRLLRARAFPEDTNQPFALVRRMWFDRFQIAEDVPLELAERKWVECFREFSGMEDYEEPAHALGLMMGLPFLNSPHIKAMRKDPIQVMGRALVVSQNLIKMVRQHHPVVLMLEDLHWTDFASWDYLMEVFLCGAELEQPNGLFILGAARLDWQPPQDLVALLATSSQPGQGNGKWGLQIPLAPLTDQAIRLLAQQLLRKALDVPEQVIDLIVERSEGVPYFTEEIVNWFIDHGILDTRNEEWHFSAEKSQGQPLPTTLQHLLLTRLNSLSKPERVILQRGAIFGRQFWTGGVEALGVTKGTQTLRRLQPRGFVEEQPISAFQGETEWSFHHNLLHEVTYESVLKRERADLHRRAASWLEKQASQADRLDEFAGLLGDHLKRAGELSLAADWYLRAGKRAMDQGSPREARGFYTQAIDLLQPVDHERCWQALLGREEALSVLNETEPRKSDINALLELARTMDNKNHLAEAYFRQAKLESLLLDIEGLDQAVQNALTVSRSNGDKVIEVKALAVATEADGWKGDKVSAEKHIKEVLDLAQSLGDDNVLSFVVYCVAHSYGLMDDFAKCYSFLNQQIELDHRLGNRAREAIGLGNLGALYLAMGLYQQSQTMIELERQICETIGNHDNVGWALRNLGESYWKEGNLQKARQVLEKALIEILPSQEARGRIACLDSLGFVLLAMGDVTGAADLFGQAHQQAREKDMEGLICETSAGLAACLLMQGKLYEASNYAHGAWNYIKDHCWVGMTNPVKVSLICLEVFDALAEEGNIRAVLENGHKSLMEVANTINIPEWRQSFLKAVPENRALLEKWERGKA